LYKKSFIISYLLASILVFLVLNDVDRLHYIFEQAISQESSLDGSSNSIGIQNQTSKEAIAVFEANSTPFGLTYGEWTAKWWQWAYAIPKGIHPAYDDSGKYCTVNQNGPVWFFPGTYGKPVIRECIIPSGKAILFPILNSECSFAEFPNLKTIQELRICAKAFQDQVTQLQAIVDGISVPDLEKYRIQSLPFNFTLPENNILGLPANTSTQAAVADGNWVFLKPLSQGKHEISFKGDTVGSNASSNNNNNITTATSNNNSSPFAFPTGWNFETTYHITVNP
jgi:hypothetical protein